MTVGHDPRPRARHAVAAWLSFVVILGLGGATWWFVHHRAPAAAPRPGIEGLASAAPPDAQFFVAVDLRDITRMAAIRTKVDALRRSNPDLGRSLDDAEKQLGVRFDDVAKCLQPAGWAALLPRDGQKSLLPTTLDGGPPCDWLVAFPVADETAMHQVVERVMASRQTVENERVRYWIDAQKGALAVTGGYLWIGSSVKTIQRALAAATTQGASLADRPIFADARNHLVAKDGLFAFIAVKDALTALDALPQAQPYVDGRVTSAVESISYLAAVHNVITGEAEAFLKIGPDAHSPLARALLGGTAVRAEPGRFFPARWGDYGEVDVPWLAGVLYQAAMLPPSSRFKMSAVPTVASLWLGFDPLTEFQKVSNGDLVWSTDAIEKLPAILRQRGVGVPQVSSAGEVTVFAALGLKDATAARALIERLEKKAHVQSRPLKTIEGSEIRTYDDLAVRWAIVSHALLVAWGPGADTRFEEALRTPSHAAEAMPATAWLQSLRNGAGRPVVVTISDLAPVNRACAEITAQVEQSSPGSAPYLKALETALQGHPPTLTTVTSVEADGVRARSRGMSLATPAPAGGATP